MAFFSYHLLQVSFLDGLKGVISSPVKKSTKGLIHSEYMTGMTLGSPILSLSRVLINEVAIFIQWENESALVNYLQHDLFGRKLAKGWHVRLLFMREWGKFNDFKIPANKAILNTEHSYVVAITIARMKPLAVPRFIYWGRPVEKLVRDHPATALSLASVKFPNTVSTFSIWNSEKEMTDMVHGHSLVQKPKRHAKAMEERDKKDFHFEFTTLRFKPVGEFGSWKGKTNYIKENPKN